MMIWNLSDGWQFAQDLYERYGKVDGRETFKALEAKPPEQSRNDSVQKKKM